MIDNEIITISACQFWRCIITSGIDIINFHETEESAGVLKKVLKHQVKDC